MSCADFDLDDEGWLDLMTALLCVFKSALDTEIRSSIRLRRSGAGAVPITVALAGFEGPALGPDREGRGFFEIFFKRSQGPSWPRISSGCVTEPRRSRRAPQSDYRRAGRYRSIQPSPPPPSKGLQAHPFLRLLPPDPGRRED